MSIIKFEEVYKIVESIPAGKVMTYGQIAAQLGDSRGARVVGWAMRATPEDKDIPWHRVVRKDGSLAPYMTHYEVVGADYRKDLLLDEGITFLKNGRIDMDKHLLEL